MPQPVPHDRPPQDVLALPRPKKGKPKQPKLKLPDVDVAMYDFESPKKDKKTKKDKKNKQRRALLQVDRKMTDKEWTDIARSVGKVRSRPFAPSSAHFGRPRIGGGYRARKRLQRARATYPVGSRWWRR